MYGTDRPSTIPTTEELAGLITRAEEHRRGEDDRCAVCREPWRCVPVRLLREGQVLAAMG